MIQMMETSLEGDMGLLVLTILLMMTDVGIDPASMLTNLAKLTKKKLTLMMWKMVILMRIWIKRLSLLIVELNKLSFPGKHHSIKVSDGKHLSIEDNDSLVISSFKTVKKQINHFNINQKQTNTKIGETIANIQKNKNDCDIQDNNYHSFDEISENVDDPIISVKLRPSNSNLNIKLSSRLQNSNDFEITEEVKTLPNKSKTLKYFDTPSKVNHEPIEPEFDPDFSSPLHRISRSTASSGRKTQYTQK